ncbi:MAG: hypothetical protein DRP97_04695 [Candidatus Latescibacterota bacterium]|nr:MAG: hypothetical protein DRP97_04695 [Candidatus Latescibacterota bacterium]
MHILFSEEDGVIVARCLDFSISSHGETLNEAMESINSALMDYMEYGIEHNAGEQLFDPDLEEYWDAYRGLMLSNSPRKSRSQLLSPGPPNLWTSDVWASRLWPLGL